MQYEPLPAARELAGAAGAAEDGGSAAPTYAVGRAETPGLSLDGLKELDAALAPLGLAPHHALLFGQLYSDNCALFLRAVRALDFDAVEAVWASFWEGGRGECKEDGQ